MLRSGFSRALRLRKTLVPTYGQAAIFGPSTSDGVVANRRFCAVPLPERGGQDEEPQSSSASQSLSFDRATIDRQRRAQQGGVGKKYQTHMQPGGNMFSMKLFELDQELRKTGRVHPDGMKQLLNHLKPESKVKIEEASFMLRACGFPLIELSGSERMEILNDVWSRLPSHGVEYDVSFFNLLLEVYIENDHQFEASEFLGKMKEKGLEPNRQTYFHLIRDFCKRGNIEGAVAVLEQMKEENLQVNEKVFDAPIYGYVRLGEREKADELIQVMTESTQSPPGSSTHCALLKGYAERGEWDQMQKIFETMSRESLSPTNEDVQELILLMAQNGHTEHISELIGKCRLGRGYFHDFMNMSVQLCRLGRADAGYQLLRTLNPLGTPGTLFVKAMIRQQDPVETILKYLEFMIEDQLHNDPFRAAVGFGYFLDYPHQRELIGKSVEKGTLEQRENIYWPLIVKAAKAGNQEEVIEILKSISAQLTQETWSQWVFPSCPNLSLEKCLKLAPEAGWSEEAIVSGYINFCLRRERYDDLESAISTIREGSTRLSREAWMDAVGFSLVPDALGKASDQHSSILIQLIKLYSDSAPARNRTDLANIVVAGWAFRLKKSDKDLQTLLQVFKEKEITIGDKIAEKVRWALPEASMEFHALLDSLVDPSTVSQSVSSQRVDVRGMTAEQQEEHFHRELQSGNTRDFVKKSLAHAHLRDGNLKEGEKYMEMLDGEDAVGVQAKLLELYCNEGNAAKALAVYEKLNSSGHTIDKNKMMKLTQVLLSVGEIEKALEVFSSPARKPQAPVAPNFRLYQNKLVSNLFNTAVEHCTSASQIRELFKCGMENGIVTPVHHSSESTIRWILKNEGLSSALVEFDRIVEETGKVPPCDELFKHLIQAEDKENLQKVYNLREARGHSGGAVNELAFALLSCGKVSQAQRVFAADSYVPMFRKIDFFLVQAKNRGDLEFLKGALKAMDRRLTPEMRQKIYHFMVEIHESNNDCNGVKAVYDLIDENGDWPTDSLRLRMAEVFDANGQPLPFARPAPPPPPPAPTEAEQEDTEALRAANAGLRKRAPNVQSRVRELMAEKRYDDAIDMALRNLSKLKHSTHQLILVQLGREGKTSEAIKYLKAVQEETQFFPNKTSVLKPLIENLTENESMDQLKELYEIIPNGVRHPQFGSLVMRAIDTVQIKKGFVDEFLAPFESKPSQFIPQLSVLSLLRERPETAERVEQLGTKRMTEAGRSDIMAVLWLGQILNGNYAKAQTLGRSHPEILTQINPSEASRLVKELPNFDQRMEGFDALFKSYKDMASGEAEKSQGVVQSYRVVANLEQGNLVEAAAAFVVMAKTKQNGSMTRKLKKWLAYSLLDANIPVPQELQSYITRDKRSNESNEKSDADPVIEENKN